MLESGAQGVCGNICSARSISIAQILKIMEEISGYGTRVEVAPALLRKDELIDPNGDPTLLHSLVGPIASLDIREILERMYHAAGHSDALGSAS